MKVRITGVRESKVHPHILVVYYKVMGENYDLDGSIRTTTTREEEIKNRIKLDAVKRLKRQFGTSYANDVSRELIGKEFDI